MKNTLPPLVITILIAISLLVAYTYLYVENNNLKNSYKKQLLEVDSLNQENIQLIEDLKMLREALHEYDQSHSGTANNNHPNL